MGVDLKDIITIAEKAYGAGGKEVLDSLIRRKKEKKEEKQQESANEKPAVENIQTEENVVVSETSGQEQVKPQETSVQENVVVSETSSVEQEMSEQPVVEQVAPEVSQPVVEETKEVKEHLVTPNSKAKDDYPGLFGFFSEMLGGKENNNDSTDQLFAEMFALAFGAMMGVDVYKEQLEKAERELQEKLEQERQARLAAEQALAEERAGKEAPQPERMPIEPVNVSEPKIDIDVKMPKPEDLKLKMPKEMAEKTLAPAELSGVKLEIDVSKVKIKTQAEMAFDQMAAGKEQVTLADLEKAGVNLKMDLQPTLKALTKDNPDKLTELAPKGLGDENAPVSKELGVALIGRAQAREAIVKHNSLSR